MWNQLSLHNSSFPIDKTLSAIICCLRSSTNQVKHAVREESKGMSTVCSIEWPFIGSEIEPNTLVFATSRNVAIHDATASFITYRAVLCILNKINAIWSPLLRGREVLSFMHIWKFSRCAWARIFPTIMTNRFFNTTGHSCAVEFHQCVQYVPNKL